uniref:Uncharacterized protein n=2 Tax=Anguilla anguilla TaxID=7936 RepID=A0A0E9RTI3_ANGAN
MVIEVTIWFQTTLSWIRQVILIGASLYNMLFLYSNQRETMYVISLCHLQLLLALYCQNDRLNRDRI